MGDRGIAPFLDALRSSKPREGWVEFLTEYSPILYQTARNCTSTDDDAADCYVNICEQLAQNNFRRLLRFNPAGTASFITWLRVVARNLCIDWHRKRSGRFRTFKSLRSRSALELEVYYHRFVHNVPPQEALARLEPLFPGVSMADLRTIEESIHQSLSSRQQWILSSRTASLAAPVAVAGEEEGIGTIEVPDPSPDQEERIKSKQEQARLQKAITSLPAEERLLLQLRFEQDLSLDEIAKLRGLGDAQRCHRALAAILKKLRRGLR